MPSSNLETQKNPLLNTENRNSHALNQTAMLTANTEHAK